MDFQIVHTGYDGLELSYRIFLPAAVLDRLADAKAQAIRSKRQVAVKIGSREFTISGSGSLGGYQYTVDTGNLGATWFFKEGNKSDPWGCRASIKSLPLAVYGAAEMKQRCDGFLRQLGCHLTATSCRLSRIDYAVDMIIPGFELDPNQFVCHSKSNKTDYHQLDAVRAGDVVTGIRIGKMPGKQLAVYDKRKDVLAKKKDYWWDIWEEKSGHELDRRQVVWRFELRAGRNAIDSYFNGTSWELIGHCLGNLLHHISGNIRLALVCSDSNRSRWPDHPIWSEIRDHLKNFPIDPHSNVDPQKILATLENERRNQILTQLFGLETSLAASIGYEADEFDEFLEDLAILRRERIKNSGHAFADLLREKRKAWLARFS